MRVKSHIWVNAYLRGVKGAFVDAALVRRGATCEKVNPRLP
jgi:hypothetical protein